MSSGLLIRRFPLGAPIIRMGTVTSTMDIARRLESLHAAEGITVIATSQTRGRGRADRSWHSSAAAGLYCSILLRPHIPAAQFQAFSIAAGLALCEALDPTGKLELRLKWPNDILHRDHKLAGMLVTTGLSGNRVEWAILGIGLNLLVDPTRPQPSIALSEISAAPRSLLAAPVPPIVRTLTARYHAILENDSARAFAHWPERLAWLHRPVAVQGQTGLLRGIDDQGALLLETNSGLSTITAGDLTRGPRLS